MVGRKLIRTGLVLLLAVAAAGIFAMVGRADDPLFGEVTSSMGPGISDAQDTVLVKASWQYIDTPTLNHSSVQFTHPAGWTLVASDPSVCSQASATTVTCPRGQIRTGNVVAQAVQLRTDSDLGQASVLPELLFSERPDNPGRLDSEPAPAVGTVSTDAGVGNSETMATVPATAELCTPFSIDERLRTNGQEACTPNYTCTLDIVNTDSALFPATDPIKLRIIFRAQQIGLLPLIFTSTTRQIQVPECPDDAVAAPDPCWSDRKAQGNKLTYWVNWTGADPGWSG